MQVEQSTESLVYRSDVQPLFAVEIGFDRVLLVLPHHHLPPQLAISSICVGASPTEVHRILCFYLILAKDARIAPLLCNKQRYSSSMIAVWLPRSNS